MTAVPRSRSVGRFTVVIELQKASARALTLRAAGGEAGGRGDNKSWARFPEKCPKPHILTCSDKIKGAGAGSCELRRTLVHEDVIRERYFDLRSYVVITVITQV